MKKFILSLVLFGIIYHANTQIISVYEHVNDTLQKVNFNKSNIVDINSRLDLTIKKDSLITRTSMAMGINKDLMAKINKLNFILENQVELLQSLEKKINEATLKDSIKSLGEFSTLYEPFLERIMKNGNEEIRAQVNGYYRSYPRLRRAGTLDPLIYPSPQAFVVKMLAKEAENVIKTMSESEDFKTLKFQLVAFLNTRKEYQRKVHILNFDNYAEGEFYEVERFATSFSEEDKATFEKTRQLANKANELLTSDLTDLKTLLRSQIKSVDCFTILLTDIQNLYENRKIIFQTDELADGETLLNDLSDQLGSVQDMLGSISAFKASSDLSSDLPEFENQQKSIVEKASALPEKLDKIIQRLSDKFGTENDSINKVLNQLKECRIYLDQDIKNLIQVGQFASHILKPIKNTAKLAEEVAGEAFKFSADNIPSFGQINLKTTGPRKNGDELEIRLKASSDDKNGNNSEDVVLEIRTLELQQVKIYSITKVTLLLAIPPSGSSVELLNQNRVQFAPSGSLLFKFGSRHSRAWNFISMGAGFNISTPDFDLNGSPDVAFGGIITILKDIVSFGYSYNTTTNTPFWFVGLSIPVTLPGIPINNVQSKKVE